MNRSLAMVIKHLWYPFIPLDFVLPNLYVAHKVEQLDLLIQEQLLDEFLFVLHLGPTEVEWEQEEY